MCVSGHSQIFWQIYTQNLGIFLSGYLHFRILPLFPSICGCPAFCHLVLLARNSRTFVLVVSAWALGPHRNSNCAGSVLATCRYSRYFSFTKSLVMSSLGSPKMKCFLPEYNLVTFRTSQTSSSVAQLPFTKITPRISIRMPVLGMPTSPCSFPS